MTKSKVPSYLYEVGRDGLSLTVFKVKKTGSTHPGKWWDTVEVDEDGTVWEGSLVSLGRSQETGEFFVCDDRRQRDDPETRNAGLNTFDFMGCFWTSDKSLAHLAQELISAAHRYGYEDGYREFAG